jgi:hypothetical protein
MVEHPAIPKANSGPIRQLKVLRITFSQSLN